MVNNYEWRHLEVWSEISPAQRFEMAKQFSIVSGYKKPAQTLLFCLTNSKSS